MAVFAVFPIGWCVAATCQLPCFTARRTAAAAVPLDVEQKRDGTTYTNHCCYPRHLLVVILE